MSNLPANMSNMLTGLKKAKTRMATASASDGADFLRLTKQADWEFGKECLEVQEGSKWAINPKSFEMGYIAWGEGVVLGEEMAPAYDDPIVKTTLPSTAAKKGWEEQYGIQLACVSGEDKGKQVIYKSTAKGAKDEIERVLDALITKVDNDEADIVAIVKLESSSYKHSKYGKIVTPILNIVKWEPITATEILEDEPEEEPEVEAEPKDEAPKRRRRKVA
tara:strand:+ start:134 stop:793 length:660 start_codon:yes stop_codon:yes gene_type:complete